MLIDYHSRHQTCEFATNVVVARFVGSKIIHKEPEDVVWKMSINAIISPRVLIAVRKILCY